MAWPGEGQERGEKLPLFDEAAILGRWYCECQAISRHAEIDLLRRQAWPARRPSESIQSKYEQGEAVGTSFPQKRPAFRFTANGHLQSARRPASFQVAAANREGRLPAELLAGALLAIDLRCHAFAPRQGARDCRAHRNPARGQVRLSDAAAWSSGSTCSEPFRPRICRLPASLIRSSDFRNRAESFSAAQPSIR